MRRRRYVNRFKGNRDVFFRFHRCFLLKRSLQSRLIQTIAVKMKNARTTQVLNTFQRIKKMYNSLKRSLRKRQNRKRVYLTFKKQNKGREYRSIKFSNNKLINANRCRPKKKPFIPQIPAIIKIFL